MNDGWCVGMCNCGREMGLSLRSEVCTLKDRERATSGRRERGMCWRWK